MARFLIHRHAAGRPHFDLRLVEEDTVRSWSMLKSPPEREGERRLAIEREHLSVEQVGQARIEEEAFGAGRARVWDSGEVEVHTVAAGFLQLRFAGSRLSGKYEMRRMRWYPGNRWLFVKSGGRNSKLT